MKAAKFEDVPLNTPFWLARDDTTYYVRPSVGLVEKHPENGPITTMENFNHTMNVFVI